MSTSQATDGQVYQPRKSSQATDGQVYRPRKQTNSVVVKGNLAAKPELRKAGETSVTSLAIYNSEIVQGIQQTNRLTAVLFGKMAEDAVQYLEQGREVTVTGRLRQRSYEDVNSPSAKALGQPIVRSTVEIVARECEWGSNLPRRAANDAVAADAAPAAQNGQPVMQPQPTAEPEPAPAATPAPEAELVAAGPDVPPVPDPEIPF